MIDAYQINSPKITSNSKTSKLAKAMMAERVYSFDNTHTQKLQPPYNSIPANQEITYKK
jgi:hypothetical protein